VKYARVKTVRSAESDANLRKESNRRAGFKRQMRMLMDPAYRERVRAYQSAYWAKHKARLSKLHKEWVAANRERINAYQRRRYELNPAHREYIARKMREYRAAKESA
jgi:uncharacterized protein (DUF342 family)